MNSRLETALAQKKVSEKARIGIAVDASCDLPWDFIQSNQIEILPTRLHFGGDIIYDRRDPELTQEFYAKIMDRREEEFADSEQPSSDEFEALMLKKWVPFYDNVICMTVTAGRSQAFNQVMKSTLAVAKRIRENKQGDGNNCTIAVLNSRTLFAGQGVLAWEAVRLRNEKHSASEIAERLKDLADSVHTYMVPSDLYYLVNRAAKKGDRSVSWGAYAIGRLLDMKPLLYCFRDETKPVAKVRGFGAGMERLLNLIDDEIQKKRLEVPCVCFSYSGEIKNIASMSVYQQFLHRAEDAGIAVLMTPMSKTGAVYVGTGAITAGFISKKHTFS